MFVTRVARQTLLFVTNCNILVRFLPMTASRSATRCVPLTGGSCGLHIYELGRGSSVAGPLGSNEIGETFGLHTTCMAVAL